jgi:predicted nucleotidyltransferase
MKEIGDRLTEEILFGSLVRGGEVKIGNRHGRMTFRFPN